MVEFNVQPETTASEDANLIDSLLGAFQNDPRQFGSHRDAFLTTLFEMQQQIDDVSFMVATIKDVALNHSSYLAPFLLEVLETSWELNRTVLSPENINYARNVSSLAFSIRNTKAKACQISAQSQPHERPCNLNVRRTLSRQGHDDQGDRAQGDLGPRVVCQLSDAPEHRDIPRELHEPDVQRHPL